MQDIVCAMELGKSSEYKTANKGKTQYFCSKACRDEFKKNPKKYTEGTPVVELRKVSKSFLLGGLEIGVLHDLSLKIWKGDFIALVGASGSGKSTAMNLMGLLDTASKGEVYIDGKKVSEMHRNKQAELRSNKIGFVFQQFNLLGALNCKENIALPLFFKKDSDAFKVNGNVDDLVERVGLKDRANHKPLEMSGGEQQRAAIARALISKPEMILADEPTGNLDSKTGEMIMDIFTKLSEEGKTLVIVTHDPMIAARAHKIIHLKDGRLVKNNKKT